MRDVIAWVNEQSVLNKKKEKKKQKKKKQKKKKKRFFKIMQCALNLCNGGILRSRITTVFKRFIVCEKLAAINPSTIYTYSYVSILSDKEIESNWNLEWFHW